MTRRRTSVIGPGRADAFAQAASAARSLAQPDAQTVWRWSLAAARELSLNLEGDPNLEAERLVAAQGHWNVANGWASGERNNGRSQIKRIRAGEGRSFWRKSFVDLTDQRFLVNEINVLTHIATTDLDRKVALREHVSWGRFGNGDSVSSAITYVETLDAGPNLRHWQAWAPCIERDGFALPVFIQAHFMAALTRKLLLALEALTAVGAVHNDVWDENLCWALPKTAYAKQQVWCAKIDFQRLEVRLIDFETCFIPGRQRLDHPHENPWVSPFVKACRQLAMEPVADGAGKTPKHPQDKQAILAAIDWGADLWSLGHLLDEWIKDAGLFMDRWLNAVRETFGDDSPVCARANRVAGEQADALQPLQAFAHRLKAQDRPLSEVGQTHLHERTPTHTALRIQLEGDFWLLTSGRNSDVVMHWIDPHAPLRAPPASRWALALSRGAQGFSGWWRLHRKKAAAAGSALAMGGVLWINAPELKAWTLDQVENGSYLTANAWLDGGGSVQSEVLQLLLDAPTSLARDAAQAGLLRSAQNIKPPSAERIKAFVAYANQAKPGYTRPAVDAEMAEQRLATLRALVIWHWSGADLGQAALAGDVLGHLEALYTVQNQLEKVGAAQLDASAVQALRRKVRPLFTVVGQRWPLARLLSIRLDACYEDGPLPHLFQNDVRSLLAIPASAEGADIYRGYALAVQERLDKGRSPCLIPPAPKPTSP